MKKKFTFVLLLTVAALPLFAGEIQHRFLACNYMGQSIHYVDQFDSSKNWTIELGMSTFDIQLIGAHQLMVSHNSGYHVYDLNTHAKVKSFSSPKIISSKSMRRLKDGRTFFAGQKGVVYEFDKDDQYVDEYQMPEAVAYLRLMRFTPQGTILLACNDGAFEVSLEKGVEPEARLVKKFLLPRPRNAYMALYAPDGGSVYVAGGYAKGFFTFDAEGQLLKETVIQQPEGLNNYFYGGFQVLNSGHIVMCNWTGHNAKDFKPGLKIVEFDKNYRVVWSWNEEFGGTVNQVIVMDELDPEKLNEDTSGILQ